MPSSPSRPLSTRGSQPHAWRRLFMAFPLLALGVVACDGSDGTEPYDDSALEEEGDDLGTTQEPLSNGGTTTNTAIGLALQVNNGTGNTVHVRAGQKFYLNQFDIVTQLKDVTVDEGVAGLDREGDFKNLDWRGVNVRDESITGNNDGVTFTRRKFYRGAKWMERKSYISIRQVDSRGLPTSLPTILNIGKDDTRTERDDFFVRRMRAIQWAYDCATPACTNPTQFMEEGLVEMRNTKSPNQTFKIQPRTTAFKIFWSERGTEYNVPVVQENDLEFDYGFKIAVKALTPPRSNGTYAPGTSIQMKLDLQDGTGKSLYPGGVMPTYNDVVLTGVERERTGITYYTAPIDPTGTYWRRKHKERMLMSQIAGPAQTIQPIRSIQGFEVFLGPADVQTIATLERDNTFAQFRIFPTSNQTFAGIYDQPVPTTWTYDIPANSPSGTYYITTKGRRVYKGEDIPFTSQVAIQVGTTTVTTPTLTTGPCTSCHSNGGELSKVLHANDNRATCAGCHAPLAFELEGPIFVRLHYIHSRSDRFDSPLSKCQSCHLNQTGIQRTSKAACLSCHTSYPASHVAQFGPVIDSYVGGGPESFQQCTGSCHTSHPGSGL